MNGNSDALADVCTGHRYFLPAQTDTPIYIENRGEGKKKLSKEQ